MSLITEALFGAPVEAPASFTYGMGEWGKPPIIRGEGKHILACKRYPVRKLMAYDVHGNLDKDSPHNLIPLRFVEGLEQNQQIANCCRHPENHDIEAWYSCEEDYKKGIPDIYKFHCTCGRVHVRFCIGGNNPITGEKDYRPFWDVR